MGPARTAFAALALTAVLACEPVLEPKVSVDDTLSADTKGSGSSQGGAIAWHRCGSRLPIL